MYRNRLIIFFIPPEKIVNGGILSIFSICAESRKFKKIHNAEVVLSTYPGTKSYRKNDLFKNDETIYSFDEIVKWGTPKFLHLHVPEYASWNVFSALKANYSEYLNAIPNLSVNIMTQNIWLLQKPHEVANWFIFTPNVTQTIAHNKAATQELADQYYLPTHLLSVFNDPAQYKWVPYEGKEDLIVLSPDKTTKRGLIVRRLRKEFPSFRIVTIKNMRYEDYKDLIGRAKFTITFGEGFDGYYIEAFFSGGITFAVYNEAFFPDKDFSKFGNTYPSYDDMSNRIVQDIKTLENKERYEEVVKKNLNKIKKLYDFSTYLENLKNFYQKKFTYLPSQHSAQRLIASILADRDATLDARQRLLEEKETAIQGQSKMIEEKAAALIEQDKIIKNLLNSRSWRITKPLRQASAIVKKII